MPLKNLKNKSSSTEIQYDERFPLYIGFWKRSIAYKDNDIVLDNRDEPHTKRRLTILNKYPEMKQFYGVEPLTIPITFLATLAQLFFAFLCGHGYIENTWMMLLLAYVIGGSITQLYGVIIHEVTHCLASTSPLMNRLVGLMANVCIPFPIYASFRRYHLDHHAFQGVEGKDPDLPLKWEIHFARGNAIKKFIFLFFYPVMYVVRGAALKKIPSKWEWINLGFTICTNFLIYHYLGPRALLYLFCSLWFGYGIHPAAAHFIQEHYTVVDGQETYSYYGSGNGFFLNIGYHNEHHDFAKVPWSKLPCVKQMAPEFYEPLRAHTSWTRVLYDFVLDKELGPASRVGRTHETHKMSRRMILEANKSQVSRSDSGLEVE